MQRQCSGTAGRIENCQIGVFLGVPEDVVLTTKPKPGRRMLARALAAGVPCAWVTSDSVYGADYALRRWIEQQRRGYVLTVTSGQRLGCAGR